MSRIVEQKFTSSSSTWTAPSGITRILLIGSGGGGAGCGTTTQGGGGGGGAIPSQVIVTVAPNTTYTVTIGAGGTGASGAAGGDGADTTFGSLATFTGASGGGNSSAQNPGASVRGIQYQNLNANTYLLHPGCGGYGGVFGSWGGAPGCRNITGGFAGGTYGGFATNHEGGGGGGAGGEGAGANAPAGVSGAAVNGNNASANTGAGGSGSGGGGSGTATGGNGGSGYLYVIYVD